MASELFNAIEKQYSVKALQNILTNLENVNLKNSIGETALAAVIRIWTQWTDKRPRKGVDSKDFKSYIVKAVQLLIDAGVDIHSKNRTGQSVIEALITSNYRGVQFFEILEILIEVGADVNSKNNYGRTALHLAAMDMYNQIDFIRLVLKHGVDVDLQDDFDFTALQYAVQKPNKEVFECLIQAGAHVNLKNEDGQTALHLAANNNNPNQVSFIRLLLQHGVDIDSQDCDGCTALQYAVRNQNKEVVQYLIDAGADLNLKNRKGQSVIEVLITSRYRGVQLMLEILEVLIKAGADINSSNRIYQTALRLAAKDKCNRIDFIRLLLKHGADVDSRDQFGWTALHWAVKKENKDVVHCLIDAGADINIKTPNGETPLHLAADAVYVDLIKYLIIRGADVNEKDIIAGKTPLHNLMKPTHRRFEGNKLLLAQADALEVLLSAGADVNAVDLFHVNTPLHYFMHGQFSCSCPFNLKIKISESFFRILKIFIKYRADFKIKNLEDETPMDIFLDNCYRYENVKYPIILLETLIKYGLMDVDSLFSTRRPGGRTLLHDYCCESHNYKMIKFLVNYGANINVVDEKSETPLLQIMWKLTDADSTSKDRKTLDYFLSLNPDLNVTSAEGDHILNLDFYDHRTYPDFVWKALIECIAKKQLTDCEYLLDEDIAWTISQDTDYGYQSYLDKCTEELQSLKERKFPGLNLLNILMDPQKKLVCYAKNKVFTKEYNELSLAKTYPIYGPYIVKRFSKARQKLEAMKGSAVILSSCLPCPMDPSHLVIEKIICYLKGKFLRYLCEPESNKELKKKIIMEQFKIFFDKYVGSCYKIK